MDLDNIYTCDYANDEEWGERTPNGQQSLVSHNTHKHDTN